MRTNRTAGILIALATCANLLAGESRERPAQEVRIASRTSLVGDSIVHTEWYVNQEHLQAQPRWDGLSSEPPLPAVEACRLAFKAVRAGFTNVGAWSVQSITIRNLLRVGPEGNIVSYPDVWCYEITLCPREHTLKDKLWSEFGDQPFTQVILFDRTTATPRTTVKPADPSLHREPDTHGSRKTGNQK